MKLDGDWEVSNYEKGVLHGGSVLFHDWEERRYVNGILQGTAKRHTEDNTVQYYLYYDNGTEKTIQEAFALQEEYENGNFRWYNLSNGVKHGTTVFLFSENEEWADQQMVEGWLQGEAVYHLSNRNWEEYSILDSTVQGKSVWHNLSGDWEERYYESGVLQGRAVYHHRDGTVEEYEYDNGSRMN